MTVRHGQPPVREGQGSQGREACQDGRIEKKKDDPDSIHGLWLANLSWVVCAQARWGQVLADITVARKLGIPARRLSPFLAEA